MISFGAIKFSTLYSLFKLFSKPGLNEQIILRKVEPLWIILNWRFTMLYIYICFSSFFAYIAIYICLHIQLHLLGWAKEGKNTCMVSCGELKMAALVFLFSHWEMETNFISLDFGLALVTCLTSKCSGSNILG